MLVKDFIAEGLIGSLLAPRAAASTAPVVKLGAVRPRSRSEVWVRVESPVEATFTIVLRAHLMSRRDMRYSDLWFVRDSQGNEYPHEFLKSEQAVEWIKRGLWIGNPAPQNDPRGESVL